MRWFSIVAWLLIPTLAAAAPTAIAPGVYVIIHPGATEDWPNGNTTVVVGERGVLVMDACYLPSAARADIAEIKKLTKKPVRWLVNSHWHYDHTNGDYVYRDAFPGLEIIVQEETRRLMDENGPRWVHAAIAPGSPERKTIAEKKTQLGAPGILPAAKKTLEADIAAREKELVELAAWTYAPPTTMFRDELDVDLGGRQARILHLGRGNTPGDTTVYLPAEKILIAGDLLVGPVPYAYYSFPAEWIVTLRALRALGATAIVPGHGEVMHDYAYLDEVVDLLESVTRQVARMAADDKTADEVRKAIDLTPFHDRMVAGKADMEDLWKDSILGALVDRAWLWARGGV